MASPRARSRFFSVRYDYTPFYEGRAAFWPLYLNAQAPIIAAKLEQAGERYAFSSSPDALGVRFVANSVVTTRAMLERHPDIVRRFLDALLRGWREALDPANEEAAVRVLLEADRETPAAVVRRQLPVTRELMLPPGRRSARSTPRPGGRPRMIMRSRRA